MSVFFVYVGAIQTSVLVQPSCTSRHGYPRVLLWLDSTVRAKVIPSAFIASTSERGLQLTCCHSSPQVALAVMYATDLKIV